MSFPFKRSGFKDLNPIEKKLLEAESVNDVMRLLKRRRNDTTTKLKLEHGYNDKRLKEDLGDDILS